MKMEMVSPEHRACWVWRIARAWILIDALTGLNFLVLEGGRYDKPLNPHESDSGL